MRTLPALAKDWGVNAEALRSFLRRRPALRELGARVGPARGYTPSEAERIRAAFDNRAAKT